MGCGKSTFGKFVAQKFRKTFIDLDEYISKKENKTIPEIFENEGENYFRLIEKKSIQQISQLKNVVVATGGGTPCFFDNMKLMTETGTTIYLKNSPQKLFETLLLIKETRPLLANKNEKELFDYINKELPLREKYYERADFQY